MLAVKRRRASANSTFQQIAGPVTSQAPEAPNRQEWRRFDLATALVTTALGTGVLVGASLLPAGQALAGCVDVTGDPNLVFCDAAQATADDTLVVNNATNETDTDERHYAFSADGDIEVEVTEDGDITGFGLAVTIRQAGDNIDMTNDGTINLDGGVPTHAPGGALVLMTSGGDISYTGSGDILTDQDVHAFFLDTDGGGTVTIDNSGSITSVGGSGIVTTNTSDVTITNSGIIESQADIGAGVHVSGVVGNATVDNSFGGSITGSGATFSSGVLLLFVSGDVVVDNRGGDIVGATDTGVAPQFITGNVFIDNSEGGSIFGGLSGITSFDVGGNVTIDNSDGGTIIGDVFHGIHLIDTGGNVAIDNSLGGTIQGNVNGVLVETAGDVSITNLLGSISGGTGDGVRLTDVDTVDIQTSGDITGGDSGIFIQANGGVNVTNLGGGTITGGTSGIEITSVNGDIEVVNDGDGHIEGGDDGIVLAALGAGNVTVLSTGTITGDANADGTGDGINTSAVNGDTEIAANDGTVTGGTFGAYATSTGTGTITVTGAGDYRGGTEAGISAVMTGLGPGAGNGIEISGTGRTISTSGTAIIADIQNGANDSNILITRSGAINGATGGIDASTVGGGDIVIAGIGPVITTTGTAVSATASGGDIDIATGGAVSGETGIAASTIGAGTVTVTVAGDVTGTAGDGIVTSAQNGDTEITANAAVTGADDGIDATATGAGDIHVGVGGTGEVTGLTGAGVSTDTATGEATIDNAGLIQGAFAAISGATSTVLEVVNQAGGLIQNLSADIGDLAISVTGTGNTEIDNDGTIRGRIELGSGDDTFTNSGLWATTGTNDFGAGNDSVTNTGRLVVAEQAAVAEITHLANLETFTNASTGVIDMVDDNAPNVGDELTIDGVYTGVPGSIIQMDLALVAGDPQAGSDLLILDPANPATGTSDLLFNIVSTGVTATTADTGRVGFVGGQFLDTPVTVVENRGTLVTSSGDDNIPLARSGFINYDLVSTAPAGGDYQVVSSLDPGLAGGVLLPIHATLAAVAFTTQRTPNPITATCIDPDNKPNAQGGWARVFGADFTTETAGTAKTNGTVGELESENRTRFATLQGGLDHVLCNLDGNGGNLHLGVTVGHTFGSSRQTDPDALAGIFGTDVEFDTFFVGPYAAYTRGDLAIQASLRFDHHSLELTNPTVGLDADGIDFDASAVSGTAAVSYDFDVMEDLTVTPEIGINVSKTEIDKFDIAGGTVILDDLWSAIGHVGVTARTTIPVIDNVFVVPFASATLYHEFIESADAKLIIGPTTTDVESNRVGTFGQLGIGANAVRLGNVVTGRPTLFGGARFDLQVGERIEGATATVFGRVQF